MGPVIGRWQPLGMHTFALPTAPSTPAGLPAPSTLWAAAFDHLAMTLWPAVARVFGYRFAVGCEATLMADGHRVLAEVWSRAGFAPADDGGSTRRRHDEAVLVWILCYRGSKPVGVMALLDPRIASPALEYGNDRAPASIDLGRTAEIARLAILKEHRGGAQSVMVGLLREMLRWSKVSGYTHLLAGARRGLFDIYARYNPSARLLPVVPAGEEAADRALWYGPLRAWAGEGVVFTFSVAGASPWNVFYRFLRGRLRTTSPQVAR